MSKRKDMSQEQLESQLEKIVDGNMKRIESFTLKPVSLEKAKKLLAEKYGAFDRRKRLWVIHSNSKHILKVKR